jgi:predicted HAD superfamily Cof-like phosphohydrolase
MSTENKEKTIYTIFEDHNSNSKNILEPQEIVDLVDEIQIVNYNETPLNKVKLFMDAFKQNVNSVPAFPDNSTMLLRLDLGLEELIELAEACGSNILSQFGTILKNKAEEIRDNVEKNREKLQPSMVKVLDALVDNEYINLGTVHSFGLTNFFPDGFDNVHESNMTKLCTSMEEAIQTQNNYLTQSISTEIVPHNSYFLVVRTRDNKILKSINYTPANLEQFLNGIQSNS